MSKWKWKCQFDVMVKDYFISPAAILFNFSVMSDLFSQSETNIQHNYPKTVGYMSIVLPLVKINKDKTTNDLVAEPFIHSLPGNGRRGAIMVPIHKKMA